MTTIFIVTKGQVISHDNDWESDCLTVHTNPVVMSLNIPQKCHNQSYWNGIVHQDRSYVVSLLNKQIVLI